MADPTVKLRIETTGAADARREIEQVAATSDRVAKGALDTARAQNAAMAETARVMLESSRAKESATKATVAEADAMSVLEKQAKRAADQVERLALARGKSPETAAGLADSAFEKVRAGASPAATVWQARSGIAAESARADAGLGRVDQSVGKLGKTAGGTMHIVRGLADALLPNILVSHVIGGGRAIIAMFSAMSAGVAALTGIVGGVLLAAFLAFRSAMRESEEAGEKLNRTIEEGSRLAEQAADRHDLNARSLGQSYAESEKTSRDAALAAERYTFSLRQASDAVAALLAYEEKRHALDERAEKAAIRAKYQTQLAALKRDELALQKEGTGMDVEFSAKLAGATDPNERRSLQGQWNSGRAGLKSREAALRERVSLLEGERDDLMAKAESKRAEKDAVSQAKAAAEEAAIAIADAKAAHEAHRRYVFELDALTRTVAEREAEFAASPVLSSHAGVLKQVDPARRAGFLSGLTDTASKNQDRARKLDAAIEEETPGYIMELMSSDFNLRTGKRTVRTDPKLAKLRAERAELGDPTKDLEVLKNLTKVDADLAKKAEEEARANADATRNAAKAQRAKEAAAMAQEAVALVKTETATAAVDRAVSAESRVASVANAGALRTADTAAREAFQRRAGREINAVTYDASNAESLYGPQNEATRADIDNLRRTAAAAGNSAARGELTKEDVDAVINALKPLAEGNRGNAEATAALREEMRTRLAAIEAYARNTSSQVRTGGAR